MGYNVLCKIAINKCNNADKHNLMKYIKNKKLECMDDWCKWRNFDELLHELTEKFPNIIFYFIYIGEYYDDNKYILVHNKKMLEFDINKILYETDEMNKITEKLDKGCNCKDECKCEDEYDDLIDRQTEIRIEAIYKQMDKLEAENIMEYFCL